MYIYERKVQYYETDKMGITHHSNHVKWMEEARIAFLEHIGLPFGHVEESGIVSPVTGVSVNYKSPSTFGDIIHIEVNIEKYTGAKLELGYTMKNEKSVLIATAVSQHCFIKDGNIISLKRTAPSMHEALERHVNV